MITCLILWMPASIPVAPADALGEAPEEQLRAATPATRTPAEASAATRCTRAQRIAIRALANQSPATSSQNSRTSAPPGSAGSLLLHTHRAANVPAIGS